MIAVFVPYYYPFPGLAESLRFELAMYDIKVQIYFPCTIYTPGYEAEKLIKPAVQFELEEGGGFITAEQAAESMFSGRSSCFGVSP